MMRPGDAMLILLPVLFLLSGASWAATLSGLGGECNRRGGRKHKLMRAILVLIKAEVIFKNRMSSFLRDFLHFDDFDRVCVVMCGCV